MAQKQVRPAVVVILGHVDHGKTTLLDYIRKSNVTEKEIGGITQRIGAFEVELPVADYATNKITFIDTPGHEAFTKLRSRGSQIADCAILIVDGVDSVMPQTVESLYHIKNANIPFIVAINKTDMPGANADKVKKDLMREGVMFEGMGGETPALSISAKQGTGVKELLEMILFITTLKELNFDPTAPARAFIIESRIEKAGVAISCIITNGILKVGDEVYAGRQKAKIRALVSDTGEHLKQVLPSQPFVLFGFKDLPEVGIELSTTPASEAEEVENELKKPVGAASIDDFFTKEEAKKLRIVVKADSQGSLDALIGTLSENASIEIMLAGVGEISKSDIFLAKVSKAVIVGFGIVVSKNVQESADEEKVIIKTYSLIYQIIEELTEVSDLLKQKEKAEIYSKGEAKILATFIIDKEKIAGIQVLRGKLTVGDEIELYRGEKLVGKSKVVSLKTRARDLSEIKKGMEGGLLLYPLLDFNIGDVVKSYSI